MKNENLSLATAKHKGVIPQQLVYIYTQKHMVHRFLTQDEEAIPTQNQEGHQVTDWVQLWATVAKQF